MPKHHEQTYVSGAETDSVFTPARIYAPLVEFFGGIGLDPCGHPDSPVPARSRVFWPERDGLRISWGGHGLVYVNPPYSQLHREHRWILKGEEADECVWLVKANTTSQWFQRGLANLASLITFLKFRVHFANQKDSVPWHSVLAYRGPRAAVWLAEIEPLMGFTVPGGAL